MTTAAEAWEAGLSAGMYYAQAAWWRIPKPKNPYEDEEPTYEYATRSASGYIMPREDEADGRKMAESLGQTLLRRVAPGAWEELPTNGPTELDPKPYISAKGARYGAGDIFFGEGTLQFLARPGYVQDEAAYGIAVVEV